MRDLVEQGEDLARERSAVVTMMMGSSLRSERDGEERVTEHWINRHVARQAQQADIVNRAPGIAEYAEDDEVRDAMSAGYGFVVVRRSRDGRAAAFHPHALDVATCEALERQLGDASRLRGIEYRC